MQRQQTSRREFLKTSALAGVSLAGAGYWVSGSPAAESTSPNEKIRFASIGLGTKGHEEAQDASTHGDLVAICDIDDKTLAKIGDAHPDARRYQDWRNMLDEMRDGIDAVTVSTPDHNHAVIAAAAMKLGKHAFVQKPLTHSLWEARTLAQIAREQKVATIMGNQHTADSNMRHTAALIKAGLLGTVKEVHVWTNRPIWPQGIERAAAKPAPSHLHWNLFLGPAPYRPFAESYHPFNWRGWWDFGTGSLGDMACHTVNMPFMALDLRDPISVEATTTGHNRDSYPSKSRITYQFAATAKRPEITLFWTDGAVKPMDLLANFKGVEDSKAGKKGKKNSADVDAIPNAAKSDDTAKDGDKKSDADVTDSKRARKPRYSDSGCVVVGEKGMLYAPGDYAEGKIQLSQGLEEMEVDFPHSPGHWNEWVAAIQGGEPAVSNFPGYAVPLTETVLLGNLAIWLATEPDVPGKKIEWDAKNLTAKNAPEVAEVIKPHYRAGFAL